MDALWKWVSDPINLTAISTLTIAAFTIALTLVGWRQAWLTRQAINETNRQHIVSNRAFVFLRQFFYVPTGKTKAPPVEHWRITPVFQNSGNTETKRMISGHSAQLREDELPADFDYPDVRWPTDVL